MADDLLIPLNKKKLLEPGIIIRRIGKDKDQQGCFLQYGDDNGLILINIIDMKTNTLVVSKGLMKPKRGEKLYYYKTTFRNSPAAEEAIAIVKNWDLYKKHRDIQTSIIRFVSATYVPEQILDLKKKDSLSLIFIPIQQKFRIGRFKDRRNPERICHDRFRFWLESLNEGEHITYVAQVLQQKDYTPRFYSSGTKPHVVTIELLRNEIFNFQPTHGGHIKTAGVKEGKKHFIVDAGSHALGSGANTPLNTSEKITEALIKLYPEFQFTPKQGRGAFGKEQSY